MPTPMSRFANRQSPNQQAKIASMMEATMGNKRLSDRDLRNLQTNPRDIGGVGNPGWHDNPALRDEDLRNLQTNPPNPALRDEDMRRLGRLPPTPPNYPRAIGGPALRDEDMRGLITNPPLADEDIGRYEPPTPPETGIGRYDRDRVPDRARRKMVYDPTVDLGPEPVAPLPSNRPLRLDPYGDLIEPMQGGRRMANPQFPVGPDIDIVSSAGMPSGYYTLDQMPPEVKEELRNRGFATIGDWEYALGPDNVLFPVGPAPGPAPPSQLGGGAGGLYPGGRYGQ